MSNEIPLFSNHFHFIQNAFLINLIDFHCHKWESQLTNNELHLTKKEFVPLLAK
jgi:hypothetical protein